MLVYIPATFEDEDYGPSWTGNNSYPTVTIRGIFESYELAEAAAANWKTDNYITIIECYCGEDDVTYNSFDIDYEGGSLGVWGAALGYYELNEIVDEEWSAVWDKDRALGVTDY
jgi:hypothetical protein